MKKNLALIVLFVFTLTATYTSCHKGENTKAFKDYKTFVENVNDSTDYYYTVKWADLNDRYGYKKAMALRDSATWSDSTKQKYMDVSNNWDHFKNMYLQHQRDLKTAEVGRLIVPSNVNYSFSNLKPEDVKATYDYFVDGVGKNKGSFTQDQWVIVDSLWDRLNRRKEEVNADISTNDKARIELEKITYGGVKAVGKTEEKK